jgi:uncharacterized metal-binding protein
MARPSEITKKLKTADSEIAAYVKELEKENLRLHKIVAKLQVESVSQKNEIKALKEQAKKPGLKVVVQKFSFLEKDTK